MEASLVTARVSQHYMQRIGPQAAAKFARRGAALVELVFTTGGVTVLRDLVAELDWQIAIPPPAAGPGLESWAEGVALELARQVRPRRLTPLRGRSV